MTVREALILTALTADRDEEARLKIEMHGIEAFAEALGGGEWTEETAAPENTPLRPDTPRAFPAPETLLQNAELTSDGFCVVPRTVE